MQKSDLNYAHQPVTGVNCPVCGFDGGELLYSVTAAEAAQHYVLKEVNPERNQQLEAHIAKLWGQQTCDSIRCGSCGFGYANPYVAGDSIFYSLAYERSSYPAWKWEYAQTKTVIAKIASQTRPDTLRLLEIGAGNGAFVRKIAPELVAKENVLCLEYSDYGQKQILDYGVECRREDVRALDPSLSGKFNLICMFQVLEHMDKLDELFKKLNFLTTEGAHLFIAVPNPKRIQFNETTGSLLDLPPNHIGRWNRSGFEWMGSAHGWQLVEHLIEPKNIADTLKQQIAYRYLRVSQDPSSFANRIERIKLGLFRKPLKSALAGIYALGRLGKLLQAITYQDLGDSQWVHLTKAGTIPKHLSQSSLKNSSTN